MDQGTIKEELRSYSRVFLDTAIFIYFFEEDENWEDLTIPIFELAEQKEIKLVTSSITALEIITGLKKEGTEENIENFWNMLQEFGVEVLEFDQQQVERAAELRVNYNLKTPDAIQLALSVGEKIPAFVTNDEKLTKVDQQETIYLADYK